jgi:signal transduction histidine kinase
MTNRPNKANDELRRELELHQHELQMLAYEIHDGFAQYASAAAYHLEAFHGNVCVEQTRPECVGLEGIRHRAESFGGCATILSTPGRGTTIVAELPVARDTRQSGLHPIAFQL